MIPPHILQMDAADKLGHTRAEFELPEGTIYLDGNSLGPLTKRARLKVQSVVEQQWGADLIQSWNKHAWIDLPTQVGEKIALLIGAAPGQVICCDSVSVNLFKVLASALALNPDRKKVVSLADNFPTDLYMVQGLSDLLGEQRCELTQVSYADLFDSLDDTVAVLLLTQVDFRTGHLLDMQGLTAQAHKHGIKVIWDLAHSAGALDVHLDACQVDFAVGCGYKYLNGGPGSPAFVYVNEKLQAHITQPLSGWMGHRAPFEFTTDYQASPGIKQYLSGTPNILSLAALDAALDVFADISMAAIRQKSIRLSTLFLELIEQQPALRELQCVSPSNPNVRGSQLSFEHPNAYELCQALIDSGVIGDFRSPNIIRFGFTPLYLSFADIWQAVETLTTVITSGAHRQSRYAKRQAVT